LASASAMSVADWVTLSRVDPQRLADDRSESLGNVRHETECGLELSLRDPLKEDRREDNLRLEKALRRSPRDTGALQT